MSNQTKLVILTILAIVGILMITKQTPTNCWDNYQTENDAITYCEEH